MHRLSARDLCLCLSLSLCSTTTLAAADGTGGNEATLDELLEGFEESAAAATPATKSDESLDSILQGFEEGGSPADGQSPDAILEGFEDTAPVAGSAAGTGSPQPSVLDTNLTVRASTVYNLAHDAPAPGETDFRGLSRARLQVVPEARWKTAGGWRGLASVSLFYDAAYALNDRDQYTAEILDAYESEAELRELYMQGSLTPKLDLKLGRQIVSWGKSDSLRVVDVLNPLDMREVGMVDIEDLRLPVTMVKLDYFSGAWQLSAIAIPEIRFNKRAPFGSEFYPTDLPPPTEEIPGDGLHNMEYALALSGRFHGWDISFHAADYYNDDFYITPTTPPLRKHSRLTLAGVAFTAVSGSVLYKAEAAYIDGLQFNHGSGSYSRFDAMLGLDYSGIRNVTLTFEVVDRYLPDHVATLELPPDNIERHENSMALRYTQTFLHERMELMLLASFSGDPGEDGGFFRAQLAYDISDSLAITGGGVFYQGGDGGFFDAISDNDRLFLELQYNI